MQFCLFTAATMVISGAHADTHKAAASQATNWQTTYEVLADATKCACDTYNQRSTGDEWWDTCTDCTFDGTICNSAEGHIGGDEFTYYCEKKCGAQGAEVD
ncbi:hypothetical protein FPHYL_3652 [Fusarium phyllophilum]|uniref:Uncharacterized protein n=1 Tax=Fusarium phyllophilum TaxID=47803 RepID=A0A8H5K612_9HYPO|nr:hypothetical protein FPHYL_3652 [Fusarium phyllophilum]